MAIHHWDRMDNEKLIIEVEPKVFVMNTLRNLVLRLNYKQNLDLGGSNTGNLVQCLQYSILIPHRAMFNKREKQGSRSAQNRRQYLLHQIVGRQFLFKGTISWLRKGER